MKLTKRQKLILIVGGAIFVLIFALGVRFLKRPQPKTELTLWLVGEKSEVWDNIVQSYQKQYPQFNIKVLIKNPDTYESELLSSMALNKGPDIFEILNTDVSKYRPYINPLASSPDFSLKQIEDDYPMVVKNDFTLGDKIYALPLYLDSLVLYYNQALFDYYQIALPPKTWEDVERLSKQLRKIDRYDRISRAGIALGLSANINWFNDILAAMMMQNGALMYQPETNRSSFNWGPKALSNAGVKALSFYTSFGQAASPNYTWNSSFKNSLEAFASGQSAMYVGYGEDRFSIQKLAPDLNFGLTNLPQFANGPEKLSFARYYGLTVSSQSQKATDAWNFIKFIATRPLADYYFKATLRPPARRDLIDYYKNEPQIGDLIAQALISRSFYQKDPSQMKEVFKKMIDDVIYNGANPNRAVYEAGQRADVIYNQ